MIGPGCLLFAGFFTWILGLLSIGLWVGCYFECPSGRDTEYNYYVAVWTGVIAFLAGIFHMVFCCGKRFHYNKIMVWLAALFSFILLPCTLLLATLSGYLSWREWDTDRRYQYALDTQDPEDDAPIAPEGDYVVGVALFATMGVVGVVLLFLTLIFNCYHCCGNSEIDEDENVVDVEPNKHEENPHGQINSGYHRDYFKPPPPAYAHEHNTHSTSASRPVYNTGYNGTRRTQDTHVLNETARSHQSRTTRDHRYNYSTGAGTEYGRSGERRADYGRSSGSQYGRHGGQQQYDSRASRAQHPASYSHQPAAYHGSQRHGGGGRAATTGYAANPNHQSRYGGRPANHIQAENPWSFGSRENIVGSTRSHQANYF